MFRVTQPEAVRVERYWLAGGAPAAPSPKEAEELKVAEAPLAAACRTPPPQSDPGAATAPPFFSPGLTISQPRSSSSGEAPPRPSVVKE